MRDDRLRSDCCFPGDRATAKTHREMHRCLRDGVCLAMRVQRRVGRLDTENRKAGGIKSSSSSSSGSYTLSVEMER